MKFSILIAAFIFSSTLVCQSQNWERQYKRSVKKVRIGDKDEFTGIKYIFIKDPEFWIHTGIKLNPYMGITEDGHVFFGMEVRIGAGDYADGEELLFKINGQIMAYNLGEVVRTGTQCEDTGCEYYQFYDILIDEALLRELAYSKSVMMRVNGRFQINDELTRIRQERIRDLHSHMILHRKVKGGLIQ